MWKEKSFDTALALADRLLSTSMLKALSQPSFLSNKSICILIFHIQLIETTGYFIHLTFFLEYQGNENCTKAGPRKVPLEGPGPLIQM